MRKFIILLIILSSLIIQCSDESSNEIEQYQINPEFTNDNQTQEEMDYFSHESEAETNIIKTEEKSEAVVKENKSNEIKTNELKNIAESGETKVNENAEVKTVSETISENIINDIDKIVYISKTGKKYHLENCRTLRGEKEAIDLNEAIETGYEACKVCNPDSI